VQLTLACEEEGCDVQPLPVTVTVETPGFVTVDPGLPGRVQEVVNVPPAPSGPKVQVAPFAQHSGSSIVPPVTGTEPFVTVIVKVMPAASHDVAFAHVFSMVAVGGSGVLHVALRTELASGATVVPLKDATALAVTVSVDSWP
jgi:hypothetical protein